MGKTRRPKPSRAAKVNPLGGPLAGAANITDELLNASANSEGPIESIIEQLQSANPDERMCSLQALAFVCQNKDKVNDIMKSDLIRIAAPLLKDNNKSVRHATSGALRNLSVWGEEICEMLVERDVLTPLLALLNEYAFTADWRPQFDQSMNNSLDESSDTFLQAVNLVWNLCESSEIALNFFNQAQILHSFIRCLNYHVFGLDIAVAVAQCVLVISEDNPTAWRVLIDCNQELSALLSIEGCYSVTLLKTLVAAIISNVPLLYTENLNPVVNALSETLGINHRSALGQLTSTLSLDGGANDRNRLEIEVTDESSMQEMPEESNEAAHKRRRLQDQLTPEELEILGVNRLLEAQRVAAEVFTNLCTSEDEAWEDNCSISSAEECVHDYDVDEPAGSGFQQTENISVELKERIKALGMVEKLWQKGQPIAENVAQILSENNEDLFEKVSKVRVSSLLCLQNLCISLSTEELGGCESVYAVWLDLGQQVFQCSQNMALLEASTSLMRAALEHLRHSPDLFKQMSDSDLQLMLGGVRSCNEAEVRANWLRMLGILGCLLSEPLVKTIVVFILETCLKENECWTISEGIDALMDMFADNDWNEIVLEVNMVQRIKEIEKMLKNKMRQQRKELGDRMPAVSTVRSNLSRFVKYVEKQQRDFVRSNQVR